MTDTTDQLPEGFKPWDGHMSTPPADWSKGGRLWLVDHRGRYAIQETSEAAQIMWGFRNPDVQFRAIRGYEPDPDKAEAPVYGAADVAYELAQLIEDHGEERGVLFGALENHMQGDEELTITTNGGQRWLVTIYPHEVQA